MQPIPGAVSCHRWIDLVFHGLREKLVDLVYFVWTKTDLEERFVIDLHSGGVVGGLIRGGCC